MRSAAIVVVLAACLHAAFWHFVERRAAAPDINGPLASVSYAPFEGITHPDDIASRPTAAQIRKDLAAIARYTNNVRTYSATGGLELVPQIASEFGLRVTVGVWIDKNDARNEREIRSALELARRYSNVDALVVGNETTLRVELAGDEAGLSAAQKAERNVAALIKIIARVKRQSPVPVTTGETWDIWLDHPTLASAVDFIAAHILPYWDRVPAASAVDHTLEIYNRLRHANPGKRVVIAEFGWPSGGYNRGAAEPGRIEQALVIRNFISRAEAMGIDYNVIEAFDQPWKSFEGSVGSYWGLFDTTRAPKFAWSGPVASAGYWKLAAIAVAAGLLISLPILSIAGATLGQVVLLAAASHAVGAWAATVFEYWNSHYFVWGAAGAFFVAMLLLVPLITIALSRVQEIAAILFGRAPRRLLPAGLRASDAFAPKVSIHVPAHMESPAMLKATLDAVSRLAYPNFECIVVINNTPDPIYWQPIEEHCRALGERFKFVNVDNLAGFKAGALRIALERTAPDAEIIGIIDADYVVQPDWLAELVPVFADARVGLIQAPQDHRDGHRSPMHAAMNGEYAGFFDIGMVERNETNAIIVHGTMCLIRRCALEQAGGWSSDTICEDTDLGLSIIEHGWVTHYTNRRYGHGLLPDTFESYKKQRHRWAYGGTQIARKHWRRMLPGASRLTAEQRRTFSIGWLNWLGAESVGVVVAILNLAWVPVVAFAGIAVPDKVLTLPIVASFAVSVVHFIALYRARVAIPPGRAIAAMFAAMSMQWTVARAVGFGLVKDHLPFVRTAKGGVTHRRHEFPAFNEAVMGGLLVLGAILIVATNHERVRELNLFAVVLVIQSIPFLAAATFAATEYSRFNRFAYWRAIRIRLAHPLPLSERVRAPAIAASTVAESLPSVERQLEVAQ